MTEEAFGYMIGIHKWGVFVGPEKDVLEYVGSLGVPSFSVSNVREERGKK